MNDPLPVFITTRDGRSIPYSVITVCAAVFRMNRPLVPFTNHGPGQACSYNSMLRGARKVLGKDKVKALWIEDDIVLMPSEHNILGLVELITEADKNDWNIVAPYFVTPDTYYLDYNHIRTDENNIPIGAPIGYTLEEVKALPKFAEIDIAGLGIFYGDIYLDYEFYEGLHDDFPNRKYTGLDWIYYTEKKIPLRHYPLSVMHMKTRMLESVV
jgi:hypothetical protein